MARTNTLGNFLTDVADSIREKKGTSEPILASDFDTEIASIESGTDLSEYFGSIESNTSPQVYSWGLNLALKKIPDITIDNSVTSLGSAFYSLNASEIGKITYTGTTLTDINSMFASSANLQSIDLSLLNVSNVTNMSSMFSWCRALTSINFNNFNTQSVTNMSSMFQRCDSMINLDLSVFETPNLENVTSMFERCSSLQHLDIRNMTFDNVTSNNSMFGGSSSYRIPANCEIIVKSNTEKEWILGKFSWLTNVKTVAEYEA